MRKVMIGLGLSGILMGCVPVDGAIQAPVEGQLAVVPEGLRTLAGPGQPLDVVRINPADGCYEYRHVGPVETTFLPLLTAEGRPICTRAEA